MDAFIRDQEAGVAKILDKSQKNRLSEIELQREGLLAVAKPDVAAKLKLTASQSEKVKFIIDEMRQAQREAMPAPPGGFRGPGEGPPPGDGPFPGGGPPPGEGGFPVGRPPQ